MKILCDVCNQEEASVFCTADEASLCDGCDHCVHHANKLASKHLRISLLHPTPKSSPLCDICQEKRAFLFCQQDRAILCRECDVQIHSSNEHTQKHNRFLLTGVKLSATASVYSNGAADLVSDTCIKSHHQQLPLTSKKPALQYSVSLSVSVSNNNNNNNNNMNDPPPSNQSTHIANKLVGDNNSLASDGIQGIDVISNNNTSSSTISEYLMEMQPCWHVEDLLDNPSNPLGFPKADDGLLSFGETDDIDGYLTSSISPSEKLGIWVPQAPHSTNFVFQQMGWQNGFKEHTSTKEATDNNVKATRRWTADDLFAVPQISPPSSGSKRSRPFW